MNALGGSQTNGWSFFSNPNFLPEKSKELAKKMFAAPVDQELIQLLKEVNDHQKAFSIDTLVESPLSDEIAIHSPLPEIAPLEPILIPKEVSSNLIEPLPQNSSLGKEALTPLPVGKITASVKTLTINGFLPLIPIFLWTLYKSEQTHVLNIQLNLEALAARKIYRIALGKKNQKEMSLAFEVMPGEKIQFLHEKIRDYDSFDTPAPLFDTTYRLEADSHPLSFNPFGLIKKFFYKRKTYLTQITININDRHNHFLQKGPDEYIKFLSKRECVQIIHRDPKALVKELPETHTIEGHTSDLASITLISLDILDPSDSLSLKQNFPLPNFEAAAGAYIEIEQETISYGF